MAYLKIPVFHWADLARGNNERKDVYHYKTSCTWYPLSQSSQAYTDSGVPLRRSSAHPNWLYGEMLLWHLQQISDKHADTSCWLSR
jgi:hypothetical protein